MADRERFSEGNEAFVAENYSEAVELYNKAIEADSSKDEYYVARAYANIKLENYPDAVSDATRAIELNPQNIKAYLRKGIAQYHMKTPGEALNTLHMGQALDGSDKSFDTWITKCEAEISLNKEKSSRDTTKQTTVTEPPGEGDTGKTSSSVDGPVTMPSGPKTRYDWYQTDSQVIINILVKNVKKKDLQTDIEEKSLGVTIRLPSGSEYSLQLDLLHTTVPGQAVVKIMGSKVEIKLKKAEGIRWSKLEGEEPEKVKQFNSAPPAPTAAAVATKYPSSSHYTRDWDKLVMNLTQEEKDEKLEGDAAVNKLFQQIYADGNDETRKAMNKSFMESGGTVLSTNWGDIAKKKTEVKPPDGMEHKQYTQ